MTEENKIIRLVTDTAAKARAESTLSMSIDAEIKYSDDDVMLVKTSIRVGDRIEYSHLMVETPRK
jgi:hypothetical protein